MDAEWCITNTGVTIRDPCFEHVDGATILDSYLKHVDGESFGPVVVYTFNRFYVVNRSIDPFQMLFTIDDDGDTSSFE
jgi:hypothetical protein